MYNEDTDSSDFLTSNGEDLDRLRSFIVSNAEDKLRSQSPDDENAADGFEDRPSRAFDGLSSIETGFDGISDKDTKAGLRASPTSKVERSESLIPGWRRRSGRLHRRKREQSVVMPPNALSNRFADILKRRSFFSYYQIWKRQRFSQFESYEGLLLNGSPSFMDKLEVFGRRTKKGEEVDYDLSVVSAEDFERLLYVITYNEGPEITEIIDSKIISTLVELYILGEAFATRNVTKIVLDELESFKTKLGNLEPNYVRRVYQGTKQDSSLRRWFINGLCLCQSKTYLEHGDDWPREAVLDLAVALREKLSDRPSKRAISSSSEPD